MTTTTPTPKGLTGRGARFWRTVVAAYEFREDELRILDDVCRTIMLVDRIEAEVAKGPLLVTGSQGQDRPNPLLGELRLQRGLLGQLVKQLAIPDPEDESDAAGQSTRSKAASHAARGRWGHGA